MVETAANTGVIAKQFVELILSYKNQWINFANLTSEEEAIITDFLTAAGVNFTKIESGKLYTNKSLDDPIGDLVNGTCPYKIVHEGTDMTFETGWLNAIVQQVRGGYSDDLPKYVYERMLQAIPLEPIQLSSEGETLLEGPVQLKDRMNPYFVKHKNDDTEVTSGAVGIHAYCHGWIEARKISETHNALHCRVCCLRLTFPATIKTYGELRQFFQKKLAQEEL